ncbi:MAG TPA: 50S ribosomal protein L22 [Verrucomicrobiae bacterium]|jgi:large subunit ribosomal protein L22|nr:50S ribosomal protein L22 [Candidatus Polarisedimenticolia bacterium]HYV18185.1 50S ribosomal protein L22 [Verrucomicrobiae bacterium]
MLPAGLVGHARLRYLGTSAQKARLVVDMIRGRHVEEAMGTLRFTPKAVAREILKVLDSAVANARVRKPEVDVDRLVVTTAFVDGGPSLKRIRPAPMGRAFRVQKRMCHVTLGLSETGHGRAARTARPAAQAQGQDAVPAGKEHAAAPARTPRKSKAAHARPSGKESAGGSRPDRSKARMPGSGSKRGGGG